VLRDSEETSLVRSRLSVPYGANFFINSLILYSIVYFTKKIRWKLHCEDNDKLQNTV